MAIGSEGDGKGARPSGTGRRLRDVILTIWMMLLLFGGGMLYPTVIIPAETPVDGVLNAKKKPVGLDFILFYGAGSLAREGNPAAAYEDAPLSAAESQAAGMKVTGLRWPYPPGMLLVARAIASLPYFQALALWVGLGVLGLALAVWRITRLPLLLLPLALCPAATYAGMLGQVGLFAAALAAAGFLLLQRRPVLAGILLGLLTLKIQLAVLIPFCLLGGRHYRSLFAFIVTGALLLALGLAYAGTGTAHAFLANANTALGHVAGSTELLFRHPTVFSAVFLADLPRLAFPLQILSSLATVAVVWSIWRRSDDLATRSLAWAAGMPLAVPYLFDYDLAVFVLPLAALAGLRQRAGIGWLQAAAMSLLWAMPPMIEPVTRAIGVQLGPVALGALLAYAAWLAYRPASAVEAEAVAA